MFQVHVLIKATYRKTESAVVSRIWKDGASARPSAGSARRDTGSTGVPSAHEPEKEPYPTKPNLHVAEIISIQASERLAEILQPVYETIKTGQVNDGYDRDVSDNYSRDDYYAFTNASSVSIECQDWIRCASPSSSVYNNSLNDHEARYLERKFPNHHKFSAHEFQHARERKIEREKATEPEVNAQHDVAPKLDAKPTDFKIEDSYRAPKSHDKRNVIREEEENLPGLDAVLEPGIEDSPMLDEIIQYMEQSEYQNKRASVVLKPEKLCPNRKKDDAIVFVDN